MHAAVIELDALPDTIRTAAQNHDLLAVGRIRFALLVIGRVHVSGRSRELGGAGVDALVHRANAHGGALATHAGFIDAEQRRETTIGETFALERRTRDRA